MPHSLWIAPPLSHQARGMSRAMSDLSWNPCQSLRHGLPVPQPVPQPLLPPLLLAPLPAAPAPDSRLQRQTVPLPKLLEADTQALVHEAQHRIANSVQIIASILRHSLRDTDSSEARREIEAAYQRIMAVAALQRALFETAGRVALAPYLEGIGQRVGKSLLIEGGNIAIRVSCAPVTIEAATATNLGLVVTELLINAIKHAFPGGRCGTIDISFQMSEAGWVLSVADDGVGRAPSRRQGLGSRIIPALAAQLDAELTEGQTQPGSRMQLTHR